MFSVEPVAPHRAESAGPSGVTQGARSEGPRSANGAARWAACSSLDGKDGENRLDGASAALRSEGIHRWRKRIPLATDKAKSSLQIVLRWKSDARPLATLHTNERLSPNMRSRWLCS